MRSILIEYLRFSNQDTGVLRGGDQYILAHLNLPVIQVQTPVEQGNLLDRLSDCLRYNSEISNEEKWKTIVEISDEIKRFFIDINAFGYKNCQLDVVLNPSELGVLPFELLLDNNQVPWFADPAKKISFTRRIRQTHLENTFLWPFVPKVLFVYAHGGFNEVPFDRHRNAFDYALSKWGGAGKAEVFTMLEEPGFEAIASELQKNDEPGKQYTHVHFLAHGDLIQDKKKPHNFEYGIRFGKGDGPITPTQSVKQLFEKLKTKPFMVNYMICDGANFSNPMKPDKNPVQVTHKAGVPIVLGSQYPLSMNGSVTITNMLYASLFDGTDIRNVLTNIRQELFRKREEHHDWISLVSYVRLPEGYEDYLYKLGLYSDMQSLKLTRAQADSYIEKRQISEDEFTLVATRLQRSIVSLETKLAEIEGQPKYRDETLENLGLLGSAYKRFAELHFTRDLLKPAAASANSTEQKAALQKSLEYYKRACDKNFSHHWSLVQYLSLDVILNKRLTDTDYWHAARRAINNTMTNADSWTYGSLLELLLLDPVPTQESREMVTKTLDNLIQKCKEENRGTFPLESTWYQVNRYRTWWNSQHQFDIDKTFLLTDTELIDQLLNKLKANFKAKK